MVFDQMVLVIIECKYRFIHSSRNFVVSSKRAEQWTQILKNFVSENFFFVSETAN